MILQGPKSVGYLTMTSHRHKLVLAYFTGGPKGCRLSMGESHIRPQFLSVLDLCEPEEVGYLCLIRLPQTCSQ